MPKGKMNKAAKQCVKETKKDMIDMSSETTVFLKRIAKFKDPRIRELLYNNYIINKKRDGGVCDAYMHYNSKIKQESN